MPLEKGRKGTESFSKRWEPSTYCFTRPEPKLSDWSQTSTQPTLGRHLSLGLQANKHSLSMSHVSVCGGLCIEENYLLDVQKVLFLAWIPWGEYEKTDPAIKQLKI